MHKILWSVCACESMRERGSERERQNDYVRNRAQRKQELNQSGLPRDLIFYYDQNSAKGNREVKQQQQKIHHQSGYKDQK